MRPTIFGYRSPQDGTPVFLDFHPPNGVNQSGEQQIAAVVYFHAGHITCREQIFGSSLALPSSHQRTGHDIIDDIYDLFGFLAKEIFSAESQTFRVDLNRVVVAGSSAGAYCANLAAMHASPKPKEIVSIYTTGGNFLIPRYLKEKTEPFFSGRDLHNTSEFQDLIYPFPNGPLAPTSNVPVVFGGPPTPITNRRRQMTSLYLQLGTYLDYVTGQHEPSLSSALREILLDESKIFVDLEMAVPQKHRRLFPQLAVDANWPPTSFMVGTADTMVLAKETYHLNALVEKAKISTILLEIPGADHLFDFAEDTDEKRGIHFDQIQDFIEECLQENSSTST